jgi:hypothetical protein
MATTSSMATELKSEEGAEVFARAARRYLNMSIDQFLEAYNSGWFKNRPDLAHNAERVAILLPLLHLS